MKKLASHREQNPSSTRMLRRRFQSRQRLGTPCEPCRSRRSCHAPRPRELGPHRRAHSLTFPVRSSHLHPGLLQLPVNVVSHRCDGRALTLEPDALSTLVRLRDELLAQSSPLGRAHPHPASPADLRLSLTLRRQTSHLRLPRQSGRHGRRRRPTPRASSRVGGTLATLIQRGARSRRLKLPRGALRVAGSALRCSSTRRLRCCRRGSLPEEAASGTRDVEVRRVHRLLLRHRPS